MSAAPRRALVTGLTGQDGSLLAELLAHEGYAVTGLTRPGEEDELGLAEPLRDRVEIIVGDLLDPPGLAAAVAAAAPDEIYHFAAPSFVPDSWRHPARTAAAIVGSTATLLEVVRDQVPAARLFVAGSAEMFGDAAESPQSEDTPCRPRTPYGTAKLAARQLVAQFREREGVFAATGILFNHESERRPAQFVTRKITRAAAAISLGRQDELVLGGLDSVRDWSYAGDIVRGAWMMLARETPEDFVLASGVGRTIREFLDAAFAVVGLDPDRYVRIDPALVRAPEEIAPVGDPSRAHDRLGWHPEVDFVGLVGRMVAADLDELGAEHRP